MLNPNNPLPLYQQLADLLSQQIAEGDYLPGTRIPSETQLADRYQLGRPTVRQATEVLVRKRVLRRRRGAGTFVSEQRPEVDLFSLGGTISSFRRSGVAMQSRWVKKLKRRKVTADPDNPFSRAIALSAERLVSVDKQAVLLERFYLDAELFAALGAREVAPESLSTAVTEELNLMPLACRQTFRIARASAQYAKYFHIPLDTPLLLVKRTLDFAGAASALFAELYCHTDELVFAQEIGDVGNA